MSRKCPGSADIRQPRPEEVRCPSCSEEVEIWSDEAKADCPRCGRKVGQGQELMSCLDWCAYAKECVGEEAYRRYLANREAGEADREK